MNFNNLKNIYPVSKTIAFQLLPVGRTAENITEVKDTDGNTVIKQNEELAERCRLVQGVADRVHKRFIEETLSRFRMKVATDGNKDSLEEYAEVFFKPIDKEKFTDKDREAQLQEIASNLKTSVARAFAEVRYKDKPYVVALASEKLCKEILPAETLSIEEQKALDVIKAFTTFMRPYFEIRNRMYQSDAKGNTVINRYVDDNLPIHLSNCRAAQRLPESVTQKMEPLMSMLGVNLEAYTLADVFSISYGALLGPQSRIDLYNTLIGGISLEDGTHVPGLNELVKMYNESSENKDKMKAHSFNKLKKQILSDRQSLSWLPPVFSNDGEVLKALEEIHACVQQLPSVRTYLNAAESADPSQVFIRANHLSSFSNTLFGDWAYLKEAMIASIKAANPMKKREKEKNYAERIRKIYDNTKAFSVAELQAAAAGHYGTKSKEFLQAYIAKAVIDSTAEAETKHASMLKYISALPKGQSLGQEEGTKDKSARGYIQKWLDSLMDIMEAMKAFSSDSAYELDSKFYGDAYEPWHIFSQTLNTVYNMVKNHFTKKPYSTDKLRLSFGNPTLMSGWDINKVSENYGVLLRKGGRRYLAILRDTTKNIFTNGTLHEDESPMQMMRVKSMPKPYRMLPKVAFADKNVKLYQPSVEVLDLKASGKPVKDYTPEEVAMFIDFYKSVIARTPGWEVFNFSFKDTAEYGSLNEFFLDVERQNYSVRYEGISEGRLMAAVKAGGVYLFEITCRGMHEAHHGKPQKYVTILEEAFKETVPGKEVLARLCGNATIYFRKASIDRKVTHPKGIAIANKNPDNPRRARVMSFDLIKDRRFTEDRFALHLPVTLNPNAPEKGGDRLNGRVQEVIRQSKDIYILGINRGERNLITAVLTAPDGTIIEQRSLNVMDGFDYARALEEREKQRKDDRRNWNAVRDIKNLKKGHITKAVGEIAHMVRKYDCIIALEDLDNKFKDTRRAYEKGEYEQFERALIEKLGYMTDKNDTVNPLGNALQLANPGGTGLQNGIVFFVSPSLISRTDPLTGFVNRIDTRYKNIREASEMLGKCESFRYCPEEDMFELSFEYAKVAPATEYGKDKVWTVYTYGERNDADNDNIPVDLTEKIKTLLDDSEIKYDDGHELLDELQERNGSFYEKLLKYLRMTLTNNVWYKDSGENRLIGCTKDADGKIFDSKNAAEGLPKDPDANAAWNIAEKCRMVIDNIRSFVPSAKPVTKGPRLVVSDAEWLNAVQ